MGPSNESTLFVLATPIGNLGDISLRALETLRHADLVFCEDTRVVKQLYSGLNIFLSARPIRSDANTSSDAWDSSVPDRHAEGRGFRAVLVTDAGTPLLSDPGEKVIAWAISRGWNIRPVPGVSAVSAFASCYQRPVSSLCFYGFFPRDNGGRLEWIEKILKTPGFHVFFESPHRIADALKGLASNTDLSAQPAMAAKEMTKLFERFFRGKLTEVSAEVEKEITREGEKGEWIFGIEGKVEENRPNIQTEWTKIAECCVRSGGGLSQTAKVVSLEYRIPKNQVYSYLLTVFKEAP